MAFCVQQQISTFAHVIGPFETYADTLLGENAAPLNRTNFAKPHHPQRHCRWVFNRNGAIKRTVAFSCCILFRSFFGQIEFIFRWNFIIYIVLYLLILCSLRYFCQEQRMFLFKGVFPILCITFSNIYDTSVVIDIQNRF